MSKLRCVRGGEASHAQYRWHLRHGESDRCPPCRQAHAEYVATFRSPDYRRAVRREPRSVREAAA